MFDTSQANCLGVDPELFFPVGAIAPNTETILKRICMSCAVFDSCLDYSLKVKVNGYWAGTTETKRVEIRRFFKITPIRIDEEYKRRLYTETNEAKNSRTYRERQREAGAR
jgi:WhiB family redox-sensing transcriptional regulator